MVTILVLFDFSKAFDMVDHQLFLSKIRDLNFSIQIVLWFISYLTSRSQAVRNKRGNISDWIAVNQEMPQEPGLRPSLFLIFINDII